MKLKKCVMKTVACRTSFSFQYLASPAIAIFLITLPLRAGEQDPPDDDETQVLVTALDKAYLLYFSDMLSIFDSDKFDADSKSIEKKKLFAWVFKYWIKSRVSDSKIPKLPIFERYVRLLNASLEGCKDVSDPLGIKRLFSVRDGVRILDRELMLGKIDGIKVLIIPDFDISSLKGWSWDRYQMEVAAFKSELFGWKSE